MKQIVLTKGHVALIDDEDFERVSSLKWHIVRPNGNRSPYAEHSWRQSGRIEHVLLHRFILGIESKVHCDHIDGDGLNNQKCNLRVCSHQQNLSRRRLNQNNKSGFKGVHWNSMHGKWRAAITINGRTRHLGGFSDAKDAAIAYDREAVKSFGQFALTNSELGLLT